MIDVLQLFFGLDMNEAATYQAGQTTTIDNRRMVSAADRRMDRIREAHSFIYSITLIGDLATRLITGRNHDPYPNNEGCLLLASAAGRGR